MYIERQNGRRERRDRRVCNFFSFFSLLLADSWNNNFGLRSMTMPARENECSASVLGQIRLLPCVRANVNDDAWFLSRRSAPRMESSYDDDGKASYHWKWKLVNIRWHNCKSSQLIRKFATTQKVFFFFFVLSTKLVLKIWRSRFDWHCVLVGTNVQVGNCPSCEGGGESNPAQLLFSASPLVLFASTCCLT